MDSRQRSNRLPCTVRPIAGISYFLWVCGGALLLGSTVVVWYSAWPFDLGRAVAGLVFTLLLLGLAYLFLSLSFQRIVVFPDRLVATPWLFFEPRTIFFSNLTRLDQVTAGPLDLFCVYSRSGDRPLRLLDLYSGGDLAIVVDAYNARPIPTAPDPQILRRAQDLRGGRQQGGPDR